MSTANKTLIILSPGFPANEADSTCLPFPQLFVRTLKKDNPSLDIIVLAFQYPFVASAYKWHGVHVIPFNGRNKGMINRLLVWRKVWRKLKTIIKGNENNILGILNFWLGECALIGKYAAKKYQVKNLTWLLGQDARKNNRYFNRIKPSSSLLIALSDFIAAEFYKNYKIRPAHIIPPGIDTGSFPSDANSRDIDIMGAGSLIALKQYDIFVKVVAELARNKSGIKAFICGKGPEKERLQQLIDDNNLSQQIILYGEFDHFSVLNLMKRSVIFLHPSSYEGFATVISEALYSGALVVSFCKPMNTQFKNHHVVASETEMIETVSKILNDTNRDHDPVITYPIEETCRKVLLLYES